MSLEPPFSLNQALFPKSIQDHAEGKGRELWGEMIPWNGIERATFEDPGTEGGKKF